MNHLVRLLKEEEGQAMTEYGLLVGLIAVAVIGALVLVGDELEAVFTTIKDELAKI
ncbi:Flp family type IVb pilin [Oceanobacillus saliphilus]|uniref:Flp family type IVb pilin n=1 Tax=Oceanobacillus saliphilus TaxID=2925834 RepID=UPI00201DBB0E|nr:Flp family type IVb pilin [Oceanobacillus saliphilus]